MYGKKANEELDIELDEVLSKDATAGDFIHDFVNSDNPKFAGKSKEKRKQMALAAYYAKQKNEELSPKQKALDKNKNGKIDGSDLAKLRGEELSAKQKALDKNNNGKIDGSDLAHLRSKKKQPQGADFAAQRRKERMASTGRMDEAKSDYEIYHKDYSTAVQTAIKQAEKRGYEVDMDDWHDKVATGPKKPSSGKTNSFSINLMKDGKPSKKKLQMQVYNMDNQKYELNMYIESVEEASSPAQQAAIAIAMKKAGKKPKMSESVVDKIKAIKRGMQAKAKADDHFDKAGDPKNANASKDLKKAVRYSNLLNKEETEIVTEAKKKSWKDMRKKTKNEEMPDKATVKKGDALTGKREPIEINPELKDAAK
jgi:Ca2+-binding EF-hand superfamily protein